MSKRENCFVINKFLLIFFSFCFFSSNIIGQIVIEEEPNMLYYEMTHERIRNFWKMKDMRDVTHKNKFLMGKNRILGNISYNTGRVVIDDGQEKKNEMRSALGFFTRIRFFEQFSFNTTFYKDFNPKASARWIPNFTYSLARYNWKPNKLSYGYENYLNNRYTDNIYALGNKFNEGYYFISYGQALSDSVLQKIKLDNSTSLRLTYFIRYSLKYRTADEKLRGGLAYGKPVLGASFRLTLIWNIYVESAVYFYPVAKQKAPWDPDFSYGFGYFDWRSFRLSFTYGNWAVNRFPWNEKFYPYYGFLDGNFRVLVNWIW
ncbi:MAG: hypothetical protein H0W84_07145 [Bacteroidetes bacterium]|nr:hypothetical protein [Bacteroidota bacterium]